MRQNRFGIRGRPLLARSDYINVACLHTIVSAILKEHGKRIGIPMPKEFPGKLSYPTGSFSRDKEGEKLMDYTLYLTRIAFRILKVASNNLAFTYSIESINRNSQRVYFTQVWFSDAPATTTCHRDYLQALIYIVTQLNNSLKKTNV